jgi:hypothetical protein
MKTPLLIFLAVLPAGASGQAVDAEKWNTVERMCGKAEWVEKIPSKHDPNSYEEKRKSIKKAEVRLYQREGDAPCCGTNPPVAQSVTNREGIFEFKNIMPGKYWLVIVTGVKQYSHAVTYTPDAKNKEPIVCSDLLYDLSGGELQLGRMIHVD